MENTTHQTVIVTGGATGLGYAIAEQFVRRGANVFLNGRTEARLVAAADRLGTIDVTREELEVALTSALRLAAVSLAFAAYALMLDHDRLLAGVRFARRSAFAAVLATRLVPTLERDARGLAEAVRETTAFLAASK